MGARKNINVTGTSKNTGAATTGGTFTHFQIFASNGTTAKSNPAPLTTPQTIPAGGMLNVSDAGIYVFLGVAGSTTVGQLSNSTLITALDAAGFTGTDVIKFGTNSSMANSSDIPAFTVDAWDAAVAF